MSKRQRAGIVGTILLALQDEIRRTTKLEVHRNRLLSTLLLINDHEGREYNITLHDGILEAVERIKGTYFGYRSTSYVSRAKMNISDPDAIDKLMEFFKRLDEKAD